MILFMGYCLDSQFEKKLILKPLTQLFLDQENLIEKITFQKKIYIGKSLSPLMKMEELINMQRHIISLLLRLVPEYPISPEQIRIFTSYGDKHDHR